MARLVLVVYRAGVVNVGQLVQKLLPIGLVRFGKFGVGTVVFGYGLYID
jgi:hypothetical protein